MFKMQTKTTCLEVFLTLMLVSFVSCENLPCPNCTDQHIRIIKGSEECDECWPCSLLECHEGHGSSVACGTTVYHGAVQIHCVSCIHGANFSDRSSSDQCQPCGVCTGNHEHILKECTPESDIKCECDNGFFRNKTTKECVPCASCCMGDGSILEKCRGDGGEIGTKCKFKELYPPTCVFTPTTTAVPDISLPTQRASLSLVTLSSVTTSSLLQTSTTPALDNIIPVTSAPSENGQIQPTLATVSHHVTPSTISGVAVGKKSHDDDLRGHWPKSLTILISVLLAVFIVLFLCCAAFVFKHRVLQSIRVLAALSKKLIKEDEAATENENVRGSRECPGIIEPLLGDELPSTDIDTAGKTTESSNVHDTDLPSTVNLPKQTTSTKLKMEIPSSLDINGATSQGQRHRDRLASEGTDESEPCLEGYPTRLSTNSCEDESVIVTIDKKSASYHCPSPSAIQPNDRNIRDPQQFTSFSSHLAKQGSGFSPNQSEIGNHDTGLREISSLSSEPPIQATGDDRDYSTHLNDVPASLICDVSALLDEERMIDGKDYTMLASVLGLTTQHQIRRLQDLKQQSKSPSYHLLIEVFASTKNSGTLKHLCLILEKMERHDVIKVIDDWVSNKV